MKTIYICHPYRDDPVGNRAKVLEIVREIASGNAPILPIAPQIYLPQFMDDDTQRTRAMRFCLRLLSDCDELWIFDQGRDRLTTGMVREIEAANGQGIPVYQDGEYVGVTG